MESDMNDQPAWVIRGKTIRQLIKELQSFEDQGLEVRISLDGGKTDKPISLVEKRRGRAVLCNSENSEEQ
jgi:hypothetical protein